MVLGWCSGPAQVAAQVVRRWCAGAQVACAGAAQVRRCCSGAARARPSTRAGVFGHPQNFFKKSFQGAR